MNHNPYCFSSDIECQIDPNYPQWFLNHFCRENYVECNHKKLFSSYCDFNEMTKEHAQVIRALRVSGCTWGRISEIMEIVTNTNEQWGQLDGKIMCQKAADILVDDSEFELETRRQAKRLKIEVEELENK